MIDLRNQGLLDSNLAKVVCINNSTRIPLEFLVEFLKNSNQRNQMTSYDCLLVWPHF